jgi:hypothetical protein
VVVNIRRKKATTAANESKTKTGQDLIEAKPARNIEIIHALTKKLEESEQAARRAESRKAWDPIWIVSGKLGEASLSLAQILLWSMLVFSASFYVWAVSGKLLDLTDDVLVLLGIAGGASVIAKITASAKQGEGQVVAGATDRVPRWLDLIKTEGRPDLYKFQMALFTVLAAMFVAGKIYSTLEFPLLPAGLLTLIGISNGVYLTAKASSKTAFEELAEVDRRLQAAKTELSKLENDTELDGRKKTEDAIAAAKNALTQIAADLQDSLTKNDQGKIADLEKRRREQEEALKRAEDHLQGLTKAKKRIDDLQIAFDQKKEQALQRE